MIDDLHVTHHTSVLQSIYHVYAVESSPTPRDFELLKPLFGSTICRAQTVVGRIRRVAGNDGKAP
jgi:hypothetical protein